MQPRSSRFSVASREFIPFSAYNSSASDFGDPLVPSPLIEVGPWGEYETAEGRIYYFNKVTGESTWERPAEMNSVSNTIDSITSTYSTFSNSNGQSLQPAYPFVNPGTTRSMGTMTPMGRMTNGYQMSQMSQMGQMGQIPSMGEFGQMGQMGQVNMYGTPNINAGLVGLPPGVHPRGGPGRPIGNRPGPPGCNLFIFHIPNEMTNKHLHDLFEPFGEIRSVRIATDRRTGFSKGYGFVSFENAEDAQKAIEKLNGLQIGRKRLKVELKKERDDEKYDDSEDYPFSASYSETSEYVNNDLVHSMQHVSITPSSGPALLPSEMNMKLSSASFTSAFNSALGIIPSLEHSGVSPILSSSLRSTPSGQISHINESFQSPLQSLTHENSAVSDLTKPKE